MTALLAILGLGRPVGRRLALAILAGVAAAACAVGLTATSAWLISAAALQPPMLTLMVAITAVRAFGIGRGVLRYAERLAAHDAAFRVLATLRAGVFARLVRLSPGGLGAYRSGDLLARLVGDVDGLADLWLRLLLPYASAAIVGVGTVALEAWLEAAAGIALAITLVATAGLAPAAAIAVARRAEASIAPARGALAATAMDLLHGAPELLAAGAIDRAVGAVAVVDDRLRRAEARSAVGAGVGNLVAGLASGSALWLALVLGVAAVRDGRLDGVGLAVLALVPIAAHEVVAPLVPAARNVPWLAAAAARVHELLVRPDPVDDPGEPAAVPPGPLGIRARDLEIRYPGSPRPAVASLDLDVPAGTRALVTGPSGSGKSTLAAALLRFVEVSGGQLALVAPGVSVSLGDLVGDDVRRAIGLCEQDPYVFDATLADNLRLARPGAPAAVLEEVLQRVGLGPWLASLPLGLETPVGEHGSRLSGGQRQRLGIARALLAQVRVLVLDEPTEHLDEPGARALVAQLEQWTVGMTVLVLTHRPELFPGSAWSRAASLPGDGSDRVNPVRAGPGPS